MTTGEPENQRTTIARIVNAVTFTCQVNQSQHGLAMSMSKIKKKIRSRVSKLQGEQIWAQLTLCGTTKAEKDISLRFCCILFGTRFQCILSETKLHCIFSRTRLCCIPTPMRQDCRESLKVWLTWPFMTGVGFQEKMLNCIWSKVSLSMNNEHEDWRAALASLNKFARSPKARLSFKILASGCVCGAELIWDLWKYE